MSVSDPVTGIQTPDSGTEPRADIRAAADDLVGGLLARPWGQVSPSVYETARLVALAPWLTGHETRVDHLLATQRPDGGWGAPGGYALVPTLSAVDALLSTLPGLGGPSDTAPAERDIPHKRARAAGDGLRMLLRELPSLKGDDIPDTPASDLIAGSLVDSINSRLAALEQPGTPPAALGPLPAGARLRLPEGMDASRLDLVRAALQGGVDLPEKVFHALEVAGPLARGAAGIRVESTGTVGASPAATAAWLDGPAAGPAHPARRFLETVVADHDGLAPCGIPITAFERGWVLSGLLRAGIEPRLPDSLVKELADAIGPTGAPAAAGLPADSDTTSVALYTLALLDVRHPPDVLWHFETDGRFASWPGEQGFSITVNAHVLDAFGRFLARFGNTVDDTTRARYTATAERIVAVLCDHQRPEGDWPDRWHASPYYATYAAALALDDFGGEHAAGAVARARRWLLDTQRPDGSWGLWGGTAEETAYALQVLLLTRGNPEEVNAAVAAGHGFLLRARDEALTGRFADPALWPALWHDKDLYFPAAIVRGTVLAALHLAQERLGGTATG